MYDWINPCPQKSPNTWKLQDLGIFYFHGAEPKINRHPYSKEFIYKHQVLGSPRRLLFLFLLEHWKIKEAIGNGHDLVAQEEPQAQHSIKIYI